MYTYSTVQCTAYSVHCGCRHISSRPASVQSVADVEGGGERLEEEEVESAREGFGWHQQVQPFGQGSWHHKSSNSNRFAATGTESPSSPTGRWHHDGHDGTMNEKQVQPDLHPVFAITIDQSIIASDSTVKVSALQPWLRRTGQILSSDQE